MPAPYTQLVASATAGRRYGSFAGRFPSAVVKGDGPFTQLMVYAMPGQRFGSFANKSQQAEVPGEKGRRYGPLLPLDSTTRWVRRELT